MSALLQLVPPRGAEGEILVLDGTGAPDHYANGLPYAAGSELAVDTVSAIDHYHQGLPYTAANRLAAEILTVAPDRVGGGAAPFSANGRLAIEAAPVVASPVSFDMTVGNNTGSVYGYRNEGGDAFGTLNPNIFEGLNITRFQGNSGSFINRLEFLGQAQIPGVTAIEFVGEPAAGGGEIAETLVWTGTAYDVNSFAMAQIFFVGSDGQAVNFTLKVAQEIYTHGVRYTQNGNIAT